MYLKNIQKKYGEKIIFENFNLDIPDNKITAILGDSGIGKTTLLKIIAGTTEYNGSLELEIVGVSAVFAEQRLLKNLSVFDNLDYILKHVIKDKQIRLKEIEKKLTSLEILSNKDDYPSVLSTGMGQRVALARAFLFPSNIILMDEPFRGLDIGIKARLIKLFYNIWKEKEQTVIMVTHDINEALLMADKIVVIGDNPAIVKYQKEVGLSQDTRNLSNPIIQNIYNEILMLFINL